MISYQFNTITLSVSWRLESWPLAIVKCQYIFAVSKIPSEVRKTSVDIEHFMAKAQIVSLGNKRRAR